MEERAFPEALSDFEWEHPPVPDNDMPLDRALELLYRLCVDGKSPDEIDVIENEFRHMDIWKETEPTQELPGGQPPTEEASENTDQEGSL